MRHSRTARELGLDLGEQTLNDLSGGLQGSPCRAGEACPHGFSGVAQYCRGARSGNGPSRCGPGHCRELQDFWQLGLIHWRRRRCEHPSGIRGLIADRFIIGSPEECAEQITALMRATGCNRLVTRMQWVGMEHKYVMRTIELLGNKVAPLVDKALA